MTNDEETGRRHPVARHCAAGAGDGRAGRAGLGGERRREPGNSIEQVMEKVNSTLKVR